MKIIINSKKLKSVDHWARNAFYYLWDNNREVLGTGPYLHVAGIYFRISDLYSVTDRYVPYVSDWRNVELILR